MNRTLLCIGCLFGLAIDSAAQEIESAPQADIAADSIDELLGFKDLTELQTDIFDKKPKTPENRFGKIDARPVQDLAYQPTVYLWEAPNIKHNPLYFEDIGLERYGQDAGLLQPLMSGAHFFGRIHTLPLQAMFKRPFSCEYPLGHYRPGNCTPYLHHSFPW